MKVEVVRPRELGVAETRRWTELQSDVESFRHPFLSAEFTLALGTVSERTRVAVVSDGPTIVGFFPYDGSVLGVGKPPAGILAYRQGFVHQRGLDWSWAELMQRCGLHSIEFTDLVLPQAVGDPRLDLLASPVIDTARGWDDYVRRTKGHKHIKTIRYKDRKLCRDLPDVEFTWTDKDAPAVNTMMMWKSRQYRRSGWRDVFARRWVRDLLDILTVEPGGDLHPIVTTLRSGDRLLAVDLSLMYDHVIAGWFAAYDHEFGAYSPGAIRLYRSIEHASAIGTDYIDMARGDESFKDAMKTGDAFVGNGSVHRRSALAALHRAAKTPRTALRSYVLEHPRVRNTVRESLRVLGSARDRVSRD
ncbi:MAG TPA: GNAT family N-acetyltransferase [Acidimicrobiia bacterium]|jgi:CelD/BcsL family acetyltransferase involved in cellulose biosynthesis|nr:GNAT family N-acetyltransferase [Acidimicrobiia bacterium]